MVIRIRLRTRVSGGTFGACGARVYVFSCRRHHGEVFDIQWIWNAHIQRAIELVVPGT
jgi:hypothetical protein